MVIRSTFYPLAILLFCIFVILQFGLGYRLPLIIYINLILIFLILINFIVPFWFSFILAFISGLIFDIFYLKLWGIHFGLFLLVIILQKALLKIFEKRSAFTLLVIGEFLLLIYFLSFYVSFLIVKQPLSYLSFSLSLLINMSLYWLVISFTSKKLLKIS